MQSVSDLESFRKVFSKSSPTSVTWKPLRFAM
jgi:hypothetical protein